jgi:hypothetical protein
MKMNRRVESADKRAFQIKKGPYPGKTAVRGRQVFFLKSSKTTFRFCGFPQGFRYRKFLYEFFLRRRSRLRRGDG